MISIVSCLMSFRGHMCTMLRGDAVWLLVVFKVSEVYASAVGKLLKAYNVYWVNIPQW